MSSQPQDLDALLAQVPYLVRERVAQMTKRPQRYTLTEFYEYMRSYLSMHDITEASPTLFMALWTVYLKHPTAAHPTAAQHAPHWFQAPCDVDLKVVDAVFARAKRTRGQTNKLSNV